jgi:hypothetical protein
VSLRRSQLYDGDGEDVFETMINSSKESRSQLHLVLDERAETALRYLNDKERQRVVAKLQILETHSPESVKAKYPKLASQPGSAPHYLLRLTPKLRAIFRYLGDNTVVVEDVVAHELLARFGDHRSR